MKNVTLIFILAVVCSTYTSRAFSNPVKFNEDTSAGFRTKDSITRSGYTLIFINKSVSFDPKVKQRMIDAFFEVYPKEATRFNPDTRKKVTFVIDPSYEGVAATGGGVARYNPEWFKKHPDDIDVVTHEVMHVVQAYPNGGPGWITEGIADYVRYVYGVANKAAGWRMPDYKSGQSYKNSYRITARFLVWLETKVNASIVNKVDAAMRSKTYTPDLWKEVTGKTLDQLWEDYSKDPTLELRYR